MDVRAGSFEYFSALLESVYDSATDPDQWRVFLQGLSHALNAKSGMFRVIDERGPAIRANVHYNLDPELQEAHRRYYVGRDVYIEALRGKPGIYVVPGEAMLDQREVRRTEFFNEYMLPQDSYYVCGGLAMRNEEFIIKFGLQRNLSAGPFSSEDARFVRLFVPHIRRAARLGHLLALADRQRCAAEQALESLAVGIVLLDEQIRIVHANGKASEMLEEGRGLTVVDGRLNVTCADDVRRFFDMMTVVHSRYAMAAPPIPETILLTPGHGDAQVLLVACPIKAHQPHFLGPWPDVSMAVFVSNLEDAGLLNHEVLMTLYGLTSSEARVACALSRGRTLNDLAAEWNISRETLRTHLKRVLGKTGTKRQTDLVRLLAGKPWSLSGLHTHSRGSS